MFAGSVRGFLLILSIGVGVMRLGRAECSNEKQNLLCLWHNAAFLFWSIH